MSVEVAGGGISCPRGSQGLGFRAQGIPRGSVWECGPQYLSARFIRGFWQGNRAKTMNL